jgi:hypothetical protein
MPFGQTPGQTVSRTLQQLRDDAVIEFVDNRGHYVYLQMPVAVESDDLPPAILERLIKGGLLRFGDVNTRRGFRKFAQLI